MNFVAVPPWNSLGLIPPVDGTNPTSSERSPYTISLVDFVLRFGQTPERRMVLNGFLQYRAALNSAGLNKGFQWLDGSFLENIELIEARAPNDIDVVTFFDLPVGKSQKDLQSKFPELFPATRLAMQGLKSKFKVDAYIQDLGAAPVSLVNRSLYWYSMWSHRRDQVWKGYVQINLAPFEDAAAHEQLKNLEKHGGQS
jgi:hypothetical protein